jgi:hypothetical protein
MVAAAAGIKMSSCSMTSLHLMGAVLIFVVSMISLTIATEAHEPAATDQVAGAILPGLLASCCSFAFLMITAGGRNALTL